MNVLEADSAKQRWCRLAARAADLGVQIPCAFLVTYAMFGFSHWVAGYGEPSYAFSFDAMFAVFDYPRGSRTVNAAVLALWACVSGLPALLTRPRRGLHDLLAGTAVVSLADLPSGHPALRPSLADRAVRAWKRRTGRASRWDAGG